SVLWVILRANKAAPPGSLCGYRLNGGELIGGQNLRVRRQRFDLVDVRAQRVEYGRTRCEQRVDPAGFGQGNRPSDRQLASAWITPNRSPERHCGELQTP